MEETPNLVKRIKHAQQRVKRNLEIKSHLLKVITDVASAYQVDVILVKFYHPMYQPIDYNTIHVRTPLFAASLNRAKETFKLLVSESELIALIDSVLDNRVLPDMPELGATPSPAKTPTDEDLSSSIKYRVERYIQMYQQGVYDAETELYYAPTQVCPPELRHELTSIQPDTFDAWCDAVVPVIRRKLTEDGVQHPVVFTRLLAGKVFSSAQLKNDDPEAESYVDIISLPSLYYFSRRNDIHNIAEMLSSNAQKNRQLPPRHRFQGGN